MYIENYRLFIILILIYNRVCNMYYFVYIYTYRFVAMHYAATVFPPDDAPSRYLLLLACGDNKHEISTEAMKALYGVVHKNEDDQQISSKIMLPEFVKLVSYVYSKMQSRMPAASSGRNTDKQVLPYSIVTFSEVSSRWKLDYECCINIFIIIIYIVTDYFLFSHLPRQKC